MNARNLLAIIPSLLLTPLAAIHAAEPAKPTKPNILFILVDDLAYNDIGCFSYPGDIAPDRKVAPPAYPEKAAYAAPNQAIAMINGKRVSLTPNLDSLATQGVKLTGYHSPASVCSPSRLGLMTGATPGRFNLGGIISEKRGDTCGLPSREVTIAEALKGVGYATAAFGKWHLGTEPQFDPTRNGFDHYWPATGERSGELIRLTEQALAFLDENKAGPFFAYFAPHQPHHPNVPHPDFAGSSEKLLGKRSYMKGDGTTATQEGASAYHDVVHEVDSRIGQLLKKLDDLEGSDFRRNNPRFQEGNLEQNLAMIERLEEVAAAKDATPSQIALAWVSAQGRDIVTIPGTKRVRYVEQNAAAQAVVLSESDLSQLAEAFPVGATAGERYPDMSRVNL